MVRANFGSGWRRIWLSLVVMVNLFHKGISQHDTDSNTNQAKIELDAYDFKARSSTEEQQCPVYRVFDADQPHAPQHGAPDGCRCVDGMQGLNCGFCENDAPCRANNSTHVCGKGMQFGANDTYRAYKCALTSTLESLFTGGKAYFYLDIESRSVNLSIFNTPSINDIHAVDCVLTDCDLPLGASGGSCANVACTCTDYCSAWTKQIVETMISNQPAQVVVEEHEYDSYLRVIIAGSPFEIESLCNASACTPDPNPVIAINNVTVDPLLDEIDSQWKASATFSLFILFVIAGIFLLLVLCACLPFLVRRRRGTRKQDHYDRQLTVEEDGRINNGSKQVLEFQHLSRIVQLRPDAAKAYGKTEKIILNNISGSVESGTLLGIMGPSGAGKSSLLNILAAVESGQSRISGQILLNGRLQKKGYRRKVAYVHQDDSLYETLTVLECVAYSAMLRLPRSMKTEEKEVHVWKTLNELHLADIAHNRIGCSGKRNAGVSGGERKRVSIGMELVSQPSVIALDEPTSGLDSTAANNIIKVLSELASRNRIVILSIHQPSMKSFLSMDQILLLGGGRVMYNGKPSEVERYFEDRGFPCQAMETVADHMLDVVSDKANCKVLKSPEVAASDYEKLSRSRAALDDGEYDEGEEEISMERRSLVNEIAVLFERTAKDILRNRELFLLQTSISILLAFFAGGIFNDVSANLAGFQNRMGAFYFTLSFFAFASFSSMDIFFRERHIFVRETGAKYHRTFSYFITKISLDLFVLRVIPVTIFAFIFYWLMGLRAAPETFVVFWATLVLFNVCAGVISICISILTPSVGQANLIASVWFLIMLLFGGFLVNVQTMEPWYAWLKYASIFYYSFEILMTNELAGMLLSFDAPDFPPLPVYGEIFLKTIGMDADNQTRDLICLCSLAAGFSVLSYLLLLLRVPPSAATHFRSMQKENKRLFKLKAKSTRSRKRFDSDEDLRRYDDEELRG